MPGKKYTGSEIMHLAASRNIEKIGTVPARTARKKIIERYGEIIAGAEYYHRGNGIWQRYTEGDDAMRKKFDRNNKPILHPQFREQRTNHMGDGRARATTIRTKTGRRIEVGII